MLLNNCGSFHEAYCDMSYPKTELITNFGIGYVSSLRFPNFSPNNRTWWPCLFEGKKQQTII